jgi:hypothetical protein
MDAGVGHQCLPILGAGMSDRVEGTIVLDGLIQGKLPPGDDGPVSLREWTQAARRLGLNFNLEVEGSTFNLLPDNQPVEVEALGPGGADALADLLQELLDHYPPGQAHMVMSTVRSREYRQNTEVQTLYAVGPDGRIHTRQNLAPTKTTPPPPKLTTRDRVKLALIGLAVALGVFGISAIFIDYRGMARDAIDHAPWFESSTVQVDASRFDGLFKIEKVAVGHDRQKGQLVVTLRRAESFPRTDAQLESAWQKAAMATRRGDAATSMPDRSATSMPDRAAASMPDGASRVALDTIARGYVHCELFDRDGKIITTTEERISDLRDKDTCDVALPISYNPRLTRVVITY